ncbi:hypothetical protein EVAR_99663_1 [Eumeta japonica]|uniref:Uncharacterized protein n=1 Tax=Eumeta variegata TaxID=151549 RepID=A0A4C2AEY2_EUMVA|nr:hypothetical protein EVAR_99663_1 [Eumeta japonica]
MKIVPQTRGDTMHLLLMPVLRNKLETWHRHIVWLSDKVHIRAALRVLSRIFDAVIGTIQRALQLESVQVTVQITPCPMRGLC